MRKRWWRRRTTASRPVITSSITAPTSKSGLDECESQYLPQLALDYARVERCAPGEAAPRVRALIQKQRDALEEMSGLIRQIDDSHIRYRKRAVQRAQFLLLSDRSAQGSVTALLRRYAEEIKTPDQLFEPDDGPVAKRLHLYPVQVFGAKPLYPPAAPAARPRWPRCGRPRWTRNSSKRSRSSCWITLGWP